MLRTTPPFAAGAATYQEILGTNTGFVSAFDVNGNFVTRVVTGGNLNAPWGVAIAPAGFGIYGGDLLIGNFGDGLDYRVQSNASFNHLGVVADGTGKAIAYPGLWEIFVSSSTAANPNAIYFTAGLAQETHGLFGSISNSTTGTSTPTFNVSASSQVVTVGVGASATLTISVAPTNSFAGPVTLACSGLPSGASCSFSPTQLTVAASAPSTTTLTIQTSNGTNSYVLSALLGSLTHGGPGAITFALMLPLRNRSSSPSAGPRRNHLALDPRRSERPCSPHPRWWLAAAQAMPATPTGTSNLTVTAIVRKHCAELPYFDDRQNNAVLTSRNRPCYAGGGLFAEKTIIVPRGTHGLPQNGVKANAAVCRLTTQSPTLAVQFSVL